MPTIEEKLKQMREKAKAQSQATIVEEEIDLPEDIDMTRLSDVAKNLRVVEPNPAVTESNILKTPTKLDSLVGVVEDIDDTPEDDIDFEENYDDIEEEINQEDIEEISEVPELPIEESAVKDAKGTETLTRVTRGMVVSVTTIPFTPAKQPTNGEKPVAASRYQVLIDLPQPLQLGKEYNIVL